MKNNKLLVFLNLSFMFATYLVCFNFSILSANKTEAKKINEYIKTYNYSSSLSLNEEIKILKQANNYTLFKVSFDSTNGERVPALMYIPSEAKPPYPCVIVLHGYGGNKGFTGLFASAFIPMGYAVIGIDIEYHGDRKEEGKDVFSTDVKDDVRSLHQTIVDLRRTVDYLESRGDIDAKRIGYIGTSLGGFLGAVFSGVDKRIKTSILIVGGGNWEKMILKSQVPPFKIIKSDFCNNKDFCIKDFASKMDVIEPLNFVGLISPEPLLMINCKNDKYVPKETAEELFDSAKEPKTIEWFTCMGEIAHIPPLDKTMILIKKWLVENL